MFRSPKQQGEWVELQFIARASAQGLTVSKPWGDSVQYDFAVELGGRFHRVQVKGTASNDGTSYICNTTCSTPKKTMRARRKYTHDEVDFFAILIIPDDAWYIIPVKTEVRSRFCLAPRNPRNRYFRYLEAWDLLKDPDSRRSPVDRRNDQPQRAQTAANDADSQVPATEDRMPST